MASGRVSSAACSTQDRSFWCFVGTGVSIVTGGLTSLGSGWFRRNLPEDYKPGAQDRGKGHSRARARQLDRRSSRGPYAEAERKCTTLVEERLQKYLFVPNKPSPAPCAERARGA